MLAIIDASVATKWFIAEPLTAQAADVLRIYDERRAPRLFMSELGNALWKYVRTQTISVADAALALSLAPSRYVDLAADEDFSVAACRISAAIDHPFCDCLYLAIARSFGAPLVTADARLLSRAPLVPDITLIDLATISAGST